MPFRSRFDGNRYFRQQAPWQAASQAQAPPTSQAQPASSQPQSSQTQTSQQAHGEAAWGEPAAPPTKVAAANRPDSATAAMDLTNMRKLLRKLVNENREPILSTGTDYFRQMEI
jgi:hypothetical protein